MTKIIYYPRSAFAALEPKPAFKLPIPSKVKNLPTGKTSKGVTPHIDLELERI